MRLVGYSVVKKPNQNFTSLKDLTHIGLSKESCVPHMLSNPPPINGIYYGGVSRDSFGELDYDYCNNLLTLDLNLAYEKIIDYEHPFQFVKDLQDAIILFDYLSIKDNRFEIIEIFEIEENYVFEQSKFNQTEFLGIDITCFPADSLLLDGIFFNYDKFSKFKDCINTNGLFFLNWELIKSYFKHFLTMGESNYVEPISDFKNHLGYYGVFQIPHRNT